MTEKLRVALDGREFVEGDCVICYDNGEVIGTGKVVALERWSDTGTVLRIDETNDGDCGLFVRWNALGGNLYATGESQPHAYTGWFHPWELASIRENFAEPCRPQDES